MEVASAQTMDPRCGARRPDIDDTRRHSEGPIPHPDSSRGNSPTGLSQAIWPPAFFLMTEEFPVSLSSPHARIESRSSGLLPARLALGRASRPNARVRPGRERATKARPRRAWAPGSGNGILAQSTSPAHALAQSRSGAAGRRAQPRTRGGQTLGLAYRPRCHPGEPAPSHAMRLAIRRRTDSAASRRLGRGAGR